MFLFLGLETLFAEIDNDLITLSIMMKSPVSVEFRLQLDDWVQSLRELGKVAIRHVFKKNNSLVLKGSLI